jgi:hypothetical protein
MGMTLSDLIRRELAKSKEADPHVIGRRLLPRLTDDMRAEVLARGIGELVTEAIRFERMKGGSATENASHATGPSRRSVAMRERVYVGSEWKMLDECGVDDLLAIASDYRTRSEQLAARSLEFDALAQELKRSGCATVGEMRARAERRVAA